MSCVENLGLNNYPIVSKGIRKVKVKNYRKVGHFLLILGARYFLYETQ